MMNIVLGVAGVVVLGVVFFDLYMRKLLKYQCRMPGEEENGIPYIPYGDPIVEMCRASVDMFVLDFRARQPVTNLKVLTDDCNGSLSARAKQSMFLTWRILNLWNPEDVREVLFDKEKAFTKMDFGQITERLIGQSILNAEGEEWKRQKKIVGPAFQHERIRVVHPAMTAVADEFLEAIEREADLEEVKMHDWTRKATVEIIGKAGFGHTFHALRGESHSHGGQGEDEECGEGSLELYENVVKELANPIHLFDPLARITGARARMSKLLDGFDELLQTLIDEKRRSIEERTANGEAGEALEARDLLDMLILAHYDGEVDAALGDPELKHNLSLFFIAGHETSAGALSSAVQLLADHPEAQQKAYEEVRASYAALPPGQEELSYEQVCGLRYVKQVIQETLRYAPPAIGVMRQAAKDTVVGGYRVGKGTMVLANVQVMHHDPTNFPEPEKFLPERFDPESKTKQKRYSYSPFSMGPRQCIGNNFAMLEMRVILSKLLLKWRIEPSASSGKFRPYSGLALHAHDDNAVKLTCRT